MDRQPLTRDQLRHFRKEGFLRLEDFAPRHEVEELSPIYDRLFRDRAGWGDGNFFDFARPEVSGHEYVVPQLLYLSKYAPELLSTMIVRRGWALAHQILGSTARLDIDHGIHKPAGASAPTPWHQDEAFWDGRYDHDGFSIWIPLQPVDAHSGCLHFIPRSNRRVMRHQPIGGDPRVHGLEVADFAPIVSQVCPLPLGGASLHHVRTLHYSAANTSSVARRAYILTFSGRRRRRLIPRPQHHELSTQSAAALRARANAG